MLANALMRAPAGIEDAVQPSQLRAQERALQLAHAQLQTRKRVLARCEFLVLELGLEERTDEPKIVIPDGADIELLIVGEQHAALAAGDHLVRLKTCNGDIAKAAEELAVIAAAKRLRAVLNDDQVMCTRDADDLVHLRRRALVMNRNDRLRFRGDLPFKIGGIHVQIVTNVCKNRRSPHGYEHAIIRIPRETGDDHLVAGADARRSNRAQQRSGTAGNRQSIFAVQPFLKHLLERLDLLRVANAVMAERALLTDDVRQLVQLLLTDQGGAKHMRGEWGCAYGLPAVDCKCFHFSVLSVRLLKIVIGLLYAVFPPACGKRSAQSRCTP